MESLPAFCWGNYGSPPQGPEGVLFYEVLREITAWVLFHMYRGEAQPGSCSTIVPWGTSAFHFRPLLAAFLQGFCSRRQAQPPGDRGPGPCLRGAVVPSPLLLRSGRDFPKWLLTALSPSLSQPDTGWLMYRFTSDVSWCLQLVTNHSVLNPSFFELEQWGTFVSLLLSASHSVLTASS